MLITVVRKDDWYKIQKKLRRQKHIKKKQDTLSILKHIVSHHEIKKGKKEALNKVIIIKVDNIQLGYLSMQEASNNFHRDVWLITGIIRTPGLPSPYRSIKNISSALLAEAVIECHKQSRLLKTSSLPLSLQPITQIIVKNAISLGFRKAPTCSCKRQECSRKSFCADLVGDYWNPSIRKWNCWLKEKQ